MPYVYALKEIQFVQYGATFEQIQRMTCPESCILVAAGGHGQLRIGNAAYALGKQGLVLYCGPGETVYYTKEIESVQGLSFYRLTFGAYDALSGKLQISPPGLETGQAGGDSYYQIRELAETMERLSREKRASAAFQLQMLFQEILYLIAKAKEEEGEDRRKNSGRVIEKVLDYIDEHYAANVHRDRMAAMAGLNPEYFSRLFRKETGHSFSKYVTEMRIRKAQELLLTSRSSLRDIARRVGFANEFYLSRKFKEVTGDLPSSYPKKKKRIASVSSHYTACLLALGVTPVLAKINPFIERWFDDRLTSTYKVDLHTFHYNQIVADIAPDLVLCYDTYPDIRQLRRIAPTLTLPFAKLNASERFLTIAGIVNETERANRLLAALEEGVQRARASLSGMLGPEETVLILEIWKDKILIMGSAMGRAGHLIYNMLGFRAPERVRSELTGESWYKAISMHELPLYTADCMFVTIFDEKEGGPYAAKVMDSDEWASLPAVRNNRVYINDHGTFYNWDPLSLQIQLDIITRQLMS